MQPDLILVPFAKNAPSVNVDAIPVNLGPSDPPQAASWSQGFPTVTMTPLAAGGIPPRGQSFNGVLHDLSEHLVYIGGGGQYKWSSEFVTAFGGYSVGDVIQADSGLLSYVSLVNNNTANFNTTPGSIGSSWGLFSYVAPSAATEVVIGIARIATQAETNQGVDDSIIISPKKLIGYISSPGSRGTEASSGTALIATQTQTNDGAADDVVVTPKKMHAWFQSGAAQATESIFGVLRIATQAQVTAGTDDATVVTPSKLKSWFQSTFAAATESVAGLVRLATSSQATTGTNDTAAMTALKTSQAILSVLNAQTLQDLTGSRTRNTSYVNQTGRPIWISVFCTGSGTPETVLRINGVVVDQTNDPNSQTDKAVQAIIPNNATYRVENNQNLVFWMEIR